MPLTDTKVPIYCALLTQVGTAAPTAVILQNNIGTITLSRVSAGVYRLTSSNKFISTKTFFSITTNRPENTVNFRFTRFDNNILEIRSLVGSTPTDDGLNNTPVLIQIYNQELIEP